MTPEEIDKIASGFLKESDSLRNALFAKDASTLGKSINKALEEFERITHKIDLEDILDMLGETASNLILVSKMNADLEFPDRAFTDLISDIQEDMDSTFRVNLTRIADQIKGLSDLRYEIMKFLDRAD